VTNTWRTFGWLIAAAVRASRQKRVRIVGSITPVLMSFSATFRSSRSSNAS
jgi:hypothetical protein